MRYIIIILLFCSCSTTKIVINGHTIKQKPKPMTKREAAVLFAPLYIGCFIIAINK